MNHEDDAIGYEQAQRLRTTIDTAGINHGHLWLYYFGIGGNVSEFEVDAYLHHSLMLPRLQRDLLAQAANEILADLTPPRAPYADDLTCEVDGPPATASQGQGPSAARDPADPTTDEEPSTRRTLGNDETRRRQ